MLSITNPLVVLVLCATNFAMKPQLFQLPGKRLLPRSQDYLQNNRTVAQEQNFAIKVILVLHVEHISIVIM